MVVQIITIMIIAVIQFKIIINLFYARKRLNTNLYRNITDTAINVNTNKFRIHPSIITSSFFISLYLHFHSYIFITFYINA